MHRLSWLVMVITIAIIQQTSSDTPTLGKPPNIESQRVLLYPLSATTMPNQQFTVTFNTNFNSTPTFAMSINEYKLGDRFYIEDFQAS